MRLCTDPTCWPGRPHEHLSMPDPCPHVSRLELIAARLYGDPSIIADLENCTYCNNERT